jgi:hypothetical protein
MYQVIRGQNEQKVSAVILEKETQFGNYLITRFWSENVKGREHLEDVGVDVRIMLECVLRVYDGKMWTRSIWMRIGTRGWLL